MRADPQFKVLELIEPKRFSLGAGTQIASVNVKLGDIRERDLPKEHLEDERTLDQRKRDYASEVATEMVIGKWEAEFGTLDESVPDNRALSFLTVHQQDSVTVEIWKQGPERRTVKLI